LKSFFSPEKSESFRINKWLKYELFYFSWNSSKKFLAAKKLERKKLLQDKIASSSQKCRIQEVKLNSKRRGRSLFVLTILGDKF
jgi:hypothetical protein